MTPNISFSKLFGAGGKTRENVGLDIGSRSVKFVSLSKGEKVVLKAYNIKDLPSGQPSSADLAGAIKETFEEVGAAPREVNLSVSGPGVVVRFITLPVMSEEQLAKALVFEAEKYIPFNINEVVLDFAVLDTQENGQMNVLVAAAKKDHVQSRVDLLRGVGVNVSVVDIDALAFFNALAYFNALPPEKVSAFLELGYSQTVVAISTGNVPRFMRVIRIGGAEIVKAISEECGVPGEEAEKIRLSEKSEDENRTAAAVSSAMEELAKEIQLSFGYFESKYSKHVDDAYCSGGLVYQKGVVERLKEKLGIGINVWDPLSAVEVDQSIPREGFDAVSSRFAVSIGLALRD